MIKENIEVLKQIQNKEELGEITTAIILLINSIDDLKEVLKNK